MTRRDLTTTILTVASFFLLWGISEWIYRVMVPGVPDAGLVPLGIRPWLFAVYYGLGTLLSPIEWIMGKNPTWLCSGLAFLVPIVISFRIESNRLRRFWITLLLFSQLLLAGTHIWQTRDIFFALSPYSTAAVFRILLRGITWVLAFQLSGFVLGRFFLCRAKKANTQPIQ